MTIDEMIAELEKLRKAHGGFTKVLVNHSEASKPGYIPEEDGCPGYISIESE